MLKIHGDLNYDLLISEIKNNILKDYKDIKDGVSMSTGFRDYHLKQPEDFFDYGTKDLFIFSLGMYKKKSTTKQQEAAYRSFVNKYDGELDKEEINHIKKEIKTKCDSSSLWSMEYIHIVIKDNYIMYFGNNQKLKDIANTFFNSFLVKTNVQYEHVFKIDSIDFVDNLTTKIIANSGKLYSQTNDYSSVWTLEKNITVVDTETLKQSKIKVVDLKDYDFKEKDVITQSSFSIVGSGGVKSKFKLSYKNFVSLKSDISFKSKNNVFDYDLIYNKVEMYMSGVLFPILKEVKDAEKK